jgi:hypothetical protein
VIGSQTLTINITGDGEAYVASLLKHRLFMEVPLAWRNNATSLQKGFAEQQRGLPGIN